MFERDGVRVNCICPGVTDTPMTIGIVEKFRDAGLFWQTAESVGRIIVGIQCTEDMNGKAIYVEGGEGWEFEDSFYREQPRWLGEEPTRRMRVNSEAVQKVKTAVLVIEHVRADFLAGCAKQIECLNACTRGLFGIKLWSLIAGILNQELFHETMDLCQHISLPVSFAQVESVFQSIGYHFPCLRAHINHQS